MLGVARLRLPEKIARNLVDEELPEARPPAALHGDTRRAGAVKAATLTELQHRLDEPYTDDERNGIRMAERNSKSESEADGGRRGGKGRGGPGGPGGPGGRGGWADRAASVAEVEMHGVAAVAMTHAARFAVLRAAMDAATRKEIVVVREGVRGMTVVVEANQQAAGGIVRVRRLGAESEEANSFTRRYANI